MGHDNETEVDGSSESDDRAAAVARAILNSENDTPIYAARIAELEAKVEVLTAALANCEALMPAGGSTKSERSSKRGSGRRDALEGPPPIHVNADGTEGMRRGVSGAEPPPRRGIED